MEERIDSATAAVRAAAGCRSARVSTARSDFPARQLKRADRQA